MPPTIPPLADLFLPDKRLKASGPDHGEQFASSLDLANANTAHGPDGSSGADAPKETSSPTDGTAQAEIRERAKVATERDNETRATDKALEQQATEARHATERAETRADESAEAARRADSQPSRTDKTDRPVADATKDVTKDVTKDAPASSPLDPLAKLAASSGLISAPVALDHGAAAAKPSAGTTSATPDVPAIPTVPPPAAAQAGPAAGTPTAPLPVAAQAGPAAGTPTTPAPTAESKGQPSTTTAPSAALPLAGTTATATATPTIAAPTIAAPAAAIAAAGASGQAKPLGTPGELGHMTDAAAAVAAAKENGQPLAVGARGTGPAAPSSPGSSPAPALATAASTAPVHATTATDTVGRAESRSAASSATATPVVPPGSAAPTGAAAPLDSAPVATMGVATADAFISSIMARLRTFGHPGYPGVAARFSHPDFGAMQLTVAGRAGERVEATLIVRDQATAQLVNAAADRLSSASPEAWNGIALHVRAEGQQAGAAGHNNHDQTDRGRAAVQVIVRTPARRARVIGFGMDGRTYALDIDA